MRRYPPSSPPPANAERMVGRTECEPKADPRPGQPIQFAAKATLPARGGHKDAASRQQTREGARAVIPCIHVTARDRRAKPVRAFCEHAVDSFPCWYTKAPPELS
jgi:hypothetical protein